MSRFQERLDRIEEVRAFVTRQLVKGRIDGFDLLALNRGLDEDERKVKSLRLAMILAKKREVK